MAHILLVEDEVILAMSTQIQLEGIGHHILGIAKTARQALALISRHRPDLILMDIVIQGEINGIELTAIVNEKYNIPVIYGTAHTDLPTIEKANRTIHFGVLSKPFQMNELTSKINKAVNHHF